MKLLHQPVCAHLTEAAWWITIKTKICTESSTVEAPALTAEPEQGTSFWTLKRCAGTPRTFGTIWNRDDTCTANNTAPKPRKNTQWIAMMCICAQIQSKTVVGMILFLFGGKTRFFFRSHSAVRFVHGFSVTTAWNCRKFPHDLCCHLCAQCCQKNDQRSPSTKKCFYFFVALSSFENFATMYLQLPSLPFPLSSIWCTADFSGTKSASNIPFNYTARFVQCHQWTAHHRHVSKHGCNCVNTLRPASIYAFWTLSSCPLGLA